MKIKSVSSLIWHADRNICALRRSSIVRSDTFIRDNKKTKTDVDVNEDLQT